MSFSGNVKQELYAIIPEGRHCLVAELAAIYAIVGSRGKNTTNTPAGEKDFPVLHTENENLRRKFFTMFEKAFIMGENRQFCEQYGLQAAGSRPSCTEAFRRAAAHPMLTKKECCRRSFLRGAFLAAGSISDPGKHYHYEIVCPDIETAGKVKDVLASFGLEGKSVQRKHSQVVYLKEGEQIVRALGEMGAPKALMELENVRIYNELSGLINRQMNCDVANGRRTLEKAMRQVEDIEFIRAHMGLTGLPPTLQMMAKVRLENPEATLQELGDFLEPKIGKSGVNHRLRRLSEIAADLRKQIGEENPGDREEDMNDS